MMKVNEKVEQIIQQVMEETDADREEIAEKIEEKQEELSGFITPEGAATIIARNYGVKLEREEPEVRKLLIEDLSEGMSNIDIVGRVKRTFEPREFKRKDGSTGKVCNIVLMDKTGEIRTVLWDKMADLVSEGEIRKGTVVRLERAYIKKGRRGTPELNIGRRGKIDINPDDERADDIPPVPDDKVKISQLDIDSEFIDTFGRVIAVTEPREFERSDGSTGKVANLRIVDGTGQTRVVLWDEKTEEVERIKQGDAIKIENASVREGLQNTPELHLNWRGRIEKNPPRENIENLPEFEKKILKIEEIEPDMPVVDLAAKTQRTYPPREFTRNGGTKGQVMNVTLADETGTIRASFWGKMVETSQELKPGDTILIENARSKTGLQDKPEIQVGKQTKIDVNPENVEIEEIKPKRIKISELEGGLESVEVVGRVIELSEIREFTKSEGDRGKAASLTIGDDTGTAKAVLWNSKTTILEEVEVGDIIKITDSYTSAGDYGSIEIHGGRHADVEVNPPKGEEIPSVKEIKERTSKKERIKIDEVKKNTQAKICGTIVRVFQRQPLFKVCPKCGQNLKNGDSEILCDKCGEVVKPEARAVINIIVDDGTGNIRVVAFGKIGERLFGESAEEISEKLNSGEELSDFYDGLNLVGTEVTITGRVKLDEYYDQLELTARDLEFPDPKREAERILERIKS